MAHRFFGARVTIVFALLALSAAGAAAQATNTSPQAPVGNATPAAPATGGSPFRKSPPQPTQKQSLDYFVGTWTATWSGRESAFAPGPRTGTVTYSRMSDSPFLQMRGEGTVEGGGKYTESGTLGWHEETKILALHERTAGGTEIFGVGDWTSPISIRFETAPVTVQGKTLRLRRTIGIVSASSFTVSDETSADGKTWSRISTAVLGKAAAAK